jgi:hypothetical protein
LKKNKQLKFILDSSWQSEQGKISKNQNKKTIIL